MHAIPGQILKVSHYYLPKWAVNIRVSLHQGAVYTEREHQCQTSDGGGGNTKVYRRVCLKKTL